MTNFEGASSQELGQLQREYNRPHLPEEFLGKVEMFSKRTGFGDVYLITDIDSNGVSNGTRVDREQCKADLAHFLSVKHPDLNREEVDALVSLYKQKLDALLDEAMTLNS